ncbi:MAG: glycoside hydrolase family 15 protein [Elusimicrobiales bacterium]
MRITLLSLCCALLCSCAGVPDRKTAESLDGWLNRQKTVALSGMTANISSGLSGEKRFGMQFVTDERKDYVKDMLARKDPRFRAEGADLILSGIKAAPGSVCAAPPGKPPEPDYFFHWTRDSAIVMDVLSALDAKAPSPERQAMLADFIHFSRGLQTDFPDGGLGEPRFNMDGSADVLKWSRPQHDGPALRALTLIRHESRRAPLPDKTAAELRAAALADLDFIASAWDKPAFDLWEEYRGADYYAAVVQLAALEAGSAWAAAKGEGERAKSYSAAAGALRSALEGYWRSDAGFYAFHLGKQIYWDGTERPKPGGNLDFAIVMAALHSGLEDGPHSLLGDRVLSTTVKLEDLFAKTYPLNRARAQDEGAAMGRYDGDDYYGGNPWAFATFAWAQAHYRAASLAAKKSELSATPLNLEFFSRALRRAGRTAMPAAGDNLLAPGLRADLLRGLVLRGDDVMRTARRCIPPSGDIAEQFDKTTGAPVSARNLSWSFASFLAAEQARREAAGLY